MASGNSYFDPLMFAALPYVVIVVFLVGTIWRYMDREFSYSSLSSQFLENKKHFWGMVPFHYGILIILLGHIVGFLIPRTVLLWNSAPLRLYILEIVGLTGGFCALLGMILLIHRRMTVPKVKMLTTTVDWLVLFLILVQILLGLATAILYPWGSSWYASSAAPYIWSLVRMSPDLSYITAMPHVVKSHIILAYILVGIAPFSRLVHILVVPNQYLVRPPQVVRWHRDWKEARGGS